MEPIVHRLGIIRHVTALPQTSRALLSHRRLPPHYIFHQRPILHKEEERSESEAV